MWTPILQRANGIFANRVTLAVSTMAILLLATSASAQARYTKEEFLSLPRVCLAQEFINKSLFTPVVPEPERQQWAQRLGPAYKSFHHFCWALIDLRRASATRAEVQSHHYRSAVQNFEFVVRNADTTFPMLPEVLLRKGMTLRLLGRDAESARVFTQAIRVKSDYTPAYAALIDLHVDLQDLEGAQSLLERGLRIAPESKILLNKKSELEAATKASSR